MPEYPEGGIYYWLHRNYRIVYRIKDDEQTVEVLRFWHCSRDDLPDGLTDGIDERTEGNPTPE